MKSSKILVLFAALCLPAVCHASGADSQFTSDVTLSCGDGCNGAPVAANSSDGFSLGLAKMLFHSGVEPTVTQLAGQWKLVGEALVPDEPDTTVSNAYSPNGLKNSDGSAKGELSIQSGRETGQTNFSGRPYTTAPSVTILGLGNKTADQGPNVLTLNNDAREACFAQYAYNSNDSSLTNSHFNYECRLLDTDSQKMVCAVSLYADPSDGKLNPADKAWSGRVWLYCAYIKE